MSKIYNLYSPDQRKIDNLKRRIRGYEKMKVDISSQNRKLHKENKQLKEELQKYKEVIDKAIMYVNSTRYSDINGLQKYSIKEFWFIKELEDILNEVE